MRSALVASVVLATAADAQRIPLDTRTATLITRSDFVSDLLLDRRFNERDGVRDVKVLKDGRMFVLYGYRAFMFDPRGELIRRFEWNSNIYAPPLSVRLELTDSTVTIRDLVTWRINTFRFDGKDVSPKFQPVVRPLETRVRMRGGTTLVERTPQIPAALDSLPRGLTLERTVGVQVGLTVRNLFSIRMDTAYFRPSRDSVVVESRAVRDIAPRARPVSTRFGAGGAWAMNGDSLVAHANGQTGVVRWYAIDGRGATVIDSARFARPVRPVSSDDIADEAARLQRLFVWRTLRGAAPFMNPTNAELLGTPRVWSSATKAFFSTEDVLWVGVNRIYIDSRDDYTVSVGDDNTWAVFPRNGSAYLVTLRPLFRLTAVVGDRLFGFIDDGTAPSVEVYSVRVQ